MPPTIGTAPSVTSNLHLAALPEEEFEWLRSHLEIVKLDSEGPVYFQEDPLDYLYFPLDCIISSSAVMSDGATVEVCMIGREAVVGVSAVFGEYRARNWMRALVPGRAARLRSDVAREMFHRSAVVQRLLMRSYRTTVTQISQRAVCNGRHTMLHRLATWLLMVHDRTGTDTIPLTQETISGRLGARRASITQAACYLQNLKTISYSRGRIHIDDRKAIEAEACECYSVIKREFDSLQKLGGGRASFGAPRLKTSYPDEASRPALSEMRDAVPASQYRPLPQAVLTRS